MNRLGRSAANHRKAWDYLCDELKTDLALVQEASPPEQFKSLVYRPIDAGKYNWGSAVVAIRSDLVLGSRPRVPLSELLLDSSRRRRTARQSPGASAVADVRNGQGQHLLTAISLYGQWEMTLGGKTMYACARLHRMMSDLTSVLAASRRHPSLLAGDLNVTTQFPSSKRTQADTDGAAAAAAAFARLRAWGLTDCAPHSASTPPLTHCTCLEGDACAHVQTFRSHNRVDSNPTQLDYAFVSRSIASAMIECRVEDTAAAWQLSDHCPIILDIEEHSLGHVAKRAD
jgi:endonuclease/exonuclease/phosphatase family metal-dependent hydrolase